MASCASPYHTICTVTFGGQYAPKVYYMQRLAPCVSSNHTICNVWRPVRRQTIIHVKFGSLHSVDRPVGRRVGDVGRSVGDLCAPIPTWLRRLAACGSPKHAICIVWYRLAASPRSPGPSAVTSAPCEPPNYILLNAWRPVGPPGHNICNRWRPVRPQTIPYVTFGFFSWGGRGVNFVDE